jgi:hypothetical protein
MLKLSLLKFPFELHFNTFKTYVKSNPHSSFICNTHSHWLQSHRSVHWVLLKWNYFSCISFGNHSVQTKHLHLFNILHTCIQKIEEF